VGGIRRLVRISCQNGEAPIEIIKYKLSDIGIYVAKLLANWRGAASYMLGTLGNDASPGGI